MAAWQVQVIAAAGWWLLVSGSTAVSIVSCCVGRVPRPICTWRGFFCSGLGIRISSTPQSKWACTPSGSTPSGRVSEREKAPNARSRRY